MANKNKRGSMKIAVLAYGSITQNLYSHYFQATLEIMDEFQELGISIPTSFLDTSSLHLDDQSRLCLLANSNSSPITRETEVYYATHSHNDLNLAVENFMAREGTSDQAHVAIIKSPKYQDVSSFCPKSIHPEKVQKLEDWLSTTDYDYAIMAQFPQISSIEEVQAFLNQNESAHARTLTYYQGLPKTTQEAHRDALEFLGLNFDQEIKKRAS